MNDIDIVKIIRKLDGDDQFVGLMKRGLWYRPKACGYTDRESEAGRFTREEAKEHEYLIGEEPVTIHEFSPKDYLGSRDAIIPVIEKQPDGIIASVCMHVIANKTHRSGFKLLLSHPRLLSTSLVKATGNWKE